MDYLIVGSGLTGAVIARILSDKGHRCLVLERRAHSGGNVYDHVHPSGIRVHTYGPHYFRTSSSRIWDFVRRFDAFVPYEARVLTNTDDGPVPWPPGRDLVERIAGKNWEPGFLGKPDNFEEMALSKMPTPIYERFVRGYTEKQWGTHAHTLAAALANRFEIRRDNDPRLSPRARYQGLPGNGYAVFMQNMLAGIDVLHGVDYLEDRNAFSPKKMLIYTGPIDAFFNFRFGPLQYRGQQRREIWIPEVDWYQPGIQVNEPDRGVPHIRTLEWKHLLSPEAAAKIRGTLLTRETPFAPNNPDHFEYPFPDLENQQRYKKYRALAQKLPHTLICGRLGEYRYFDMDQAIARAMHLIAVIP